MRPPTACTNEAVPIRTIALTKKTLAMLLIRICRVVRYGVSVSRLAWLELKRQH